MADEESWEDIEQRIVTEVSNEAYAVSLMSAMQAYIKVGFTEKQAWLLIQAEHDHKMGYIIERTIASEFGGSDD